VFLFDRILEVIFPFLLFKDHTATAMINHSRLEKGQKRDLLLSSHSQSRFSMQTLEISLHSESVPQFSHAIQTLPEPKLLGTQGARWRSRLLLMHSVSFG